MDANIVELHRDLGKGFESKVKKAEFDGGDLFITYSRNVSLNVKDGNLESLRDNLEQGMGMRVFRGNKLVFVVSADLSQRGLDDLFQNAVELVKYIGESEFSANYRFDEIDRKFIDELNIYDDYINNFTVENEIRYLKGLERDCMRARREIDTSRGASMGLYGGVFSLCSKDGYFQSYKKSIYNVSLGVIAKRGGESKASHDGWVAIYRNELPRYRAFARFVANKAVRLLGGEPVKTQRMPVLFHPDAGRNLLSNIIRAFDAQSVLRGASCYAESLGKKIAHENINIIDNAVMTKGVSSYPIDGEGTRAKRKYIVEKGVLKNFLTDIYSAEKLGLEPSGNAVRGSYGSRPHINASNCFLEERKGHPVPDIIKTVDYGLYVFEILGFGIDPVSGNISVGVSGLLLKDGEMSRPVSRVTIADTFDNVLSNVLMIGNDLVFRGSVSVPHFLVENVTVSGT